MATQITQKLKEQKLSPKMKEFKTKVNILLNSAEPEIQYHIVQDLAKKMNLPFYKDTRGWGIRQKMTSDRVVKAYCRLCIDHLKKNNDEDFIKEFLMHLSEQQNQHLRKLSRRTTAQKKKKDAIKTQNEKGVWEHPIPLVYTRNILFDYIKNGCYSKIDLYIDFIFQNTYQVFLTEQWDNKLSELGLRDNMPKGWNWEEASRNNVFQRYIEAEIPQSEYLE